MFALRQCSTEKNPLDQLDPWSVLPLSHFLNTDDTNCTNVFALGQCSTEKKNPCQSA